MIDAVFSYIISRNKIKEDDVSTTIWVIAIDTFYLSIHYVVTGTYGHAKSLVM